jgi:hypothetical protein
VRVLAFPRAGLVLRGHVLGLRAEREDGPGGGQVLVDRLAGGRHHVHVVLPEGAEAAPDYLGEAQGHEVAGRLARGDVIDGEPGPVTYGICQSNGGNCVEVASNLPGTVTVRDSTNPEDPVLVFAPAEWTPFVPGCASAIGYWYFSVHSCLRPASNAEMKMMQTCAPPRPYLSRLAASRSMRFT